MRWCTTFLTGLVAALLLTVGLGVLRAEEELSEEGKRIKALDAGADEIDVSNYTKEMQESYKVARDKCGSCHSFSRVISSEYALPGEWKRYIKRMRRKSGADFSKSEAKVITEFLTYDSQQRKQDLIREKQAVADGE